MDRRYHHTQNHVNRQQTRSGRRAATMNRVESLHALGRQCNFDLDDSARRRRQGSKIGVFNVKLCRRRGCRTHWRIPVLCALFLCIESATGYQNDDFTEDTVRDDDSYEHAVIAVFSFLFAVCMSLVTVTIAYFFAIEGALLRRFLDKGVCIPAKVMQGTFVRPTTHGAEYNVTVEYRYNMNDDGDDVSGTYKYATVLRKQLKCLDRDVYKAASTAKAAQHSTPSRNRRICIEVVPQIVDSPRPFSTTIATGIAMDVSATAGMNAEDTLHAFPSFDVAIFEEPQPHSYVDVLVLPGHPHSAIVSQHVERAVQAGQKQWSNIVLLASLATLTLLGVYLGVGSVCSTSDVALLHPGNARLTWGVSLAITVALLTIELLILHTVGRNLFLEAIYQEYLHHDGAVQLKTDDETLYTISTGATSSWKTPSRPSPVPVRATDRYLQLESLTL